MGFYGQIVLDIDIKDRSKKGELIGIFNEYFNLTSEDDEYLVFSDENNFSFSFIDDLKAQLEELKSKGWIKEAKINIWYFENPDEIITI